MVRHIIKIDSIWDHVDDLMSAGQWLVLDIDLMLVEPEDTPTDELLAWITATLPGKRELKQRPELVRSAELAIRGRGEWKPGILNGLN